MNVNERLELAITRCIAIRNEVEFSYGWMSKESIDAQWVRDLENDPIKKERMSGFCARFGRLQDYFSDKVLRLWLEASGESVGTAIENYSVAESAGILAMSSQDSVEFRQIRNRLTHQYIEEAEKFAADLSAILGATQALLSTFDKLVAHLQRAHPKSK